MTNIVQESAVLLGMIQHERRKLGQELTALGVSGPTDSVTTTDQMQALDRSLALESLEKDLHHFIERWMAANGQ